MTADWPALIVAVMRLPRKPEPAEACVTRALGYLLPSELDALGRAGVMRQVDLFAFAIGWRTSTDPARELVPARGLQADVEALLRVLKLGVIPELGDLARRVLADSTLSRVDTVTPLGSHWNPQWSRFVQARELLVALGADLAVQRDESGDTCTISGRSSRLTVSYKRDAPSEPRHVATVELTHPERRSAAREWRLDAALGPWLVALADRRSGAQAALGDLTAGQTVSVLVPGSEHGSGERWQLRVEFANGGSVRWRIDASEAPSLQLLLAALQWVGEDVANDWLREELVRAVVEIVRGDGDARELVEALLMRLVGELAHKRPPAWECCRGENTSQAHHEPPDVLAHALVAFSPPSELPPLNALPGTVGELHGDTPDLCHRRLTVVGPASATVGLQLRRARRHVAEAIERIEARRCTPVVVQIGDEHHVVAADLLRAARRQAPVEVLRKAWNRIPRRDVSDGRSQDGE